MEEVWHIFSQMGCVLESLGLERFRVARREKGVPYRVCFSDDERKLSEKFMHGFPVEWVKYQSIVVSRNYYNKPYTNWLLTLSFNEKEDGVSVTFSIKADAKNAFFKIKAAKELMQQIKNAENLFERIEDYFDGDIAHPFPRKNIEYNKAQVRHQMLQVEKSSYGHGLTRRLVEFSLSGLESEVTNIRPHHIAQAWKRPTAEVTEVLMYAATTGLLTYNWYMSCPSCGHMQEPIASLDRLPKSCECLSCGTGFTRDFSRNVEMVFRPNPAHRKVSGGTYCYMNPSRRRRTLAHMYLQPGETRELDLHWPEGEIVSCTIDQKHEEIILKETTPRPLNIRIMPKGVLEEVGLEEPTKRTTIHNGRDSVVIVAIRMPYAHQMRYTGTEAITSHSFRELCRADVLERTDEIPLSNITVMFTDLKGSTAMYEDVGDLKAYQMVRDHYEMLSHIVRMHGGALVKTIGDAIMAVFMHPKDAVLAGISIQNEVQMFFNERFEENRKAVIKMGIHSGPCISVLMNNRIDFFGQMLNTAARLQNYSEGEDIVISLPVAADADVSKMLRPHNVESEKVNVKGLDEPVQILRLKFSDGLFEEELPEEDSTVVPFSGNRSVN